MARLETEFRVATRILAGRMGRLTLRRLYILSGRLFLLGLLSSCSHLHPYYGDQVPASSRSAKYAGENGADHLQSVDYRVILIGDAGKPANPATDEWVLQSARAWASSRKERTAIAFLGDNVYEQGLTRPTAEEIRRLESQIDVARASRGLFIPGNHDWGNGTLKQQQSYVDSALGRPSFFPRDAAPGPTVIDLPSDDPVVRLIAIDTQWWLRSPGPEPVEVADFQQELETALGTELPILVLAHHPLQSAGPHGGFYVVRDYLFPLTRLSSDRAWWSWIPAPLLVGIPGSLIGGSFDRWIAVGTVSSIIGTLAYPVSRRWIIDSPQDQFSTSYSMMRAELVRTLAAKDGAGRPLRPLLFAGGHEHSLQVLEGGSAADYFLVSGAGSKAKLTPVSDNSKTLFAHEHTGFMVIDFDSTGKIWLRVVEPEGSEGRQINLGKERPVFVAQLR